MKILYVGGLGIPIADILRGKTEQEITGWPAYFYPVYKLIQAGHTVDFAAVTDIKEYNIKVDWFSEKQIVVNVIIDPEIVRKKNRILRKCYIARKWISAIAQINKIIATGKYDFVYCQDYLGILGAFSVARHKIPSGVRFYGDTFQLNGKVLSKHEYIEEHGKFAFFAAKPGLYMLYKLRKSFILTTDDGSHGDLTYNALKPRKDKYDFYHWKTGVNKDKPNMEEYPDLNCIDYPYICYPARVDNIKRQDRAIKILALLHSKGYKIHLYLIGQICDQTFYEQLIKQIKDSDLEQYVHFTGGVSQPQMKAYALKAVANILVSDLSNKGNVFFELFSIGSVIISLNDHSLDEFIINDENGYLQDNEEGISENVIDLINNPGKRMIISQNAKKTADQKVMSIDERFNLEIELIEAYANGLPVGEFPRKL